MPFESDRQRRFMNAQRGKKVPAKVVDEFNAASRGKPLPETAPKRAKKKKKKGTM